MTKTQWNSGQPKGGYFTNLLSKLLPARRIDAIAPVCLMDTDDNYVVVHHGDALPVADAKSSPGLGSSYLPDEIWLIIVSSLRRSLAYEFPLNWIEKYIANLQSLAKVNRQLESLVNTQFTGKENYLQYIQHKTLIADYNLENSSIYLELVELLILKMSKPPNKNETEALFYLAVRLRALTDIQQQNAGVFVYNNFKQVTHFLLDILHKYQDKKIQPFHLELCTLLQLLASSRIKKLFENKIITFNQISEFIGVFDIKTNPSLMDLKVINNLLLSLFKCPLSLIIPKNIINIISKQLDKVKEKNPQQRTEKYVNIIQQTINDLMKSAPTIDLRPTHKLTQASITYS